MSESLMDSSLESWQRILQRGPTRYPLLTANIDLEKSEVELGTNDFVFLMMEFAEEVGFDLTDYGRKLVGNSVREDVLKFHAGVAFRTIFEVEGHYVEFPNAYAIYKVPKQFLIVIGAALIGMATGKAFEIGPVMGGVVSGVGGLLINILAARYLELQAQREPEITWTEEFILKVLEHYGEQSLRELQRHTKLYRKTIKETVESLYKKNLVEKRKVLLEGNRIKSETRYKLKSR